MSSSELKNKMNYFQSEIENYKKKIYGAKMKINDIDKKLQEIEKYIDDINKIAQNIVDLKPSFAKIGKHLEHVKVSSKEYDEGYFQNSSHLLAQSAELCTSLRNEAFNERDKLKSERNELENTISLLEYKRSIAQSNYNTTSNKYKSEINNTNSCFLKDTKVLIKNGNKNINDIKQGDLVLTYNELTHNTEYKEVINLIIHENANEELLTLHFDNYELDVTSSHRFFINNKWIEAINLKIDDEVMYYDNTYHKIELIEKRLQKDTYYNLEVKDNHNYFVSEKGVLVHNRKTID